ncbi:MAG: imidazole glycerol phosphate synthase subunit HisH [Burkholderiaceae bacterium]
MIAVVNTGVGNLRSVLLALNRACPEVSVRIASERKTLNDASKVVFPGQGSMRDCIERLNSLDMVDELRRCLVTKPFLGICLGKQILFDYSEEGGSQGLGFLPGKVKRFNTKNSVKVPHMGWNTVRTKRNHPLFNGILKNEGEDAYFYFVHSFFSKPDDHRLVLGETMHGEVFSSVISSENIFATQFHPEKSSENGIMLLKNFAGWNP